MGNRISQDALKYILDVQAGLTQVIGDSDGNRYIHSPRGIHAQYDGSEWNYFLQDGLGSVRGMIGANANVLASHNYDPYGNYIGTAPTDGYFGFTGEQTDANGQVYLRARYYTPNMGVFNALDPDEGKTCTPMSLNGYSWVEGNVVNLTDASGHSPKRNISFIDRLLAFAMNSGGCGAFFGSSNPYSNPMLISNNNNGDKQETCIEISDGIIVCFDSPTVTPSPTIPTPNPEDLQKMWSERVKSLVSESDARSCLSFIVNREVVSDSPPTFLGSGIYNQSRAITWVVLNNLALTKELDAGKRHGNNQSFVYCHPSDVSPCDGSAGYTSPNTEVERGINNALQNYRYRNTSDPTSGSLQWRHIPNDGWGEFNQNQVIRIKDESVATFYNRHQDAVSRYKAQNSGRIYFDSQVTSVAEAEEYQYLSSLGALAVFTAGSDTNGANIQDVLEFPQVGNMQPPRNSCQRA